jgi:hypothetical protein
VNLGTGGVLGIINNNTLEVTNEPPGPVTPAPTPTPTPVPVTPAPGNGRKRRELSPSLARSIELDKNANPYNSRERISPRFNPDKVEDEDNKLGLNEIRRRAVRAAGDPPPGPPPLDLPTKRAFWDLILIALKDCRMREQQLYFRRVRRIITELKAFAELLSRN